MNGFELLSGEKMDVIIELSKKLDFNILDESQWNRKLNAHLPEDADKLVTALNWILRIAVAKIKNKELGFICLFTDGNGSYWLKVSRGFATALSESHSSL